MFKRGVRLQEGKNVPSVRLREVSTYGRCPLGEVRLYEVRTKDSQIDQLPVGWLAKSVEHTNATAVIVANVSLSLSQP